MPVLTSTANACQFLTQNCRWPFSSVPARRSRKKGCGRISFSYVSRTICRNPATLAFASCGVILICSLMRRKLSKAHWLVKNTLWIRRAIPCKQGRTTMLQRWIWLGIVFLALAAPRAHAQKLDRALLTHSSESISIAPLLYGIEKGLYKKEGVDL